MTDRPATGREFTGRHMLVVMLAFFGVIVAVNLTMAMFAQTSWSGFVVQNSYVAGQHFNRKAEEGRRQAMLGWTPELAVSGGLLRFSLADEHGRVVPLAGGTATLRRPVGDADDMSVALQPAGEALEAQVAAGDGAWIIEVHARVDEAAAAAAGLDHAYRQTQRIQLRGGSTR